MVTLEQMVQALAFAVETPAGSNRCRSADPRPARVTTIATVSELSDPGLRTQGNTLNYQSACTWGTCSLALANESLSLSFDLEQSGTHGKKDYLEEIHIRILRVTEDCARFNARLNCGAMEAPSDPELIEALSQLPEMDALQVLKSAVDQMRHFLWFFMYIMTNESELSKRFQQSIRQNFSADSLLEPEARF